MPDIVGHKTLTKFSGRVEFTMHYRNSMMCGHDPDEPHWESESFDNLKSFLQLVSPDFIEQMKNVHAADHVDITHIYFDGSNDDGDMARIWVGDKMTGSSSATVVSDHIDSKMQHCVDELEKQIEGLQSTIVRYRI